MISPYKMFDQFGIINIKGLLQLFIRRWIINFWLFKD